MRIILFSLLVFTCLLGVANAQPNKISIGTVTNQIKLGPMKGNKNLTLGLKNIAEEAILDKSDKLVLVDDVEPGTYTLNMDIVYFDIQQTSTGVSVFHKTDNETIIRIKGTLLLDGKKVKDYGLYINGKFVASHNKKRFETINPANEEVLAKISLADEVDIDKAVKAARSAYVKVSVA